jgi:hypothetical protein
MDREAKQLELQRLRKEAQRLEAELATDAGTGQWPPRGYYTAYHVLAGFVLGMLGAATSLFFNIVGSLLVGQEPLRLIRVYLTFPLGAAALHPQTHDNLALAIGCCLYLGTGMVLGVPFQLVLTRLLLTRSFAYRFAVISALSLSLWLVNFYGILSWLQPVLFGGRWIVDEIPWWVGALTHLVFGWTMLAVQPLGVFVPYRQAMEAS